MLMNELFTHTLKALGRIHQTKMIDLLEKGTKWNNAV